MYPVYSPMHAYVLWLDLMMLPWKMMMAPVADSMKEATAATDPAAVADLDPASPEEIGTSATEFRAQ